MVKPYTDELVSAVDEYVSFVIAEIEEARRVCKQPIILVEQRVDASEYVDNCFGTADMVIITDKMAHIIDLKLGKGVEVHAEENPQLMIYGLGVLHMAEALYDIETVRMTIFQPRLFNSSTWDVSPDFLKRWGDEVLRPAGAKALIGAGEFEAGTWCRFCRARNQCRARAAHFLEMAQMEFRQPALLSDEEIAEIISKADELSKWAADVYAFAQDQAINHDKHWPGYKVVEGRSNRKFTSDEEVIEAAQQHRLLTSSAVSVCPVVCFQRSLILLSPRLLSTQLSNEPVFLGIWVRSSKQPTGSVLLCKQRCLRFRFLWMVWVKYWISSSRSSKKCN